MSYEGTPLTAPQASRRKIMPPTPQQSSQSSTEATHWQAEVEDQESGSCEKEFEGEHRWAARDRTVIARMEQDLNKNDSMRVAIKELESLLGPEDSEVNLRQILKCARRKKGGRIFDILSSKGQNEHLASSRVRWNERQRVMVTQEEEARRNVQGVDNEVNPNWTAVYQTIAKRMLKYFGGQRSLEA